MKKLLVEKGAKKLQKQDKEVIVIQQILFDAYQQK